MRRPLPDPEGTGERLGGAAPGEHSLALAVGAEEALAAVARAAESWGAGWQRAGRGGRLELPVSAGLRVGRLEAQVSVADERSGSALLLRVEDGHYHLRTNALIILLVAAGGALVTVLWPFFPRLLPVAPVGALLALSAWFLVISRLQVSGPEDFLGLVADLAGAPADERRPG